MDSLYFSKILIVKFLFFSPFSKNLNLNLGRRKNRVYTSGFKGATREKRYETYSAPLKATRSRRNSELSRILIRVRVARDTRI